MNPSFDDRHIPSALKALPQWVCWKAKPNGERVEKIPVCASTGTLASSTDPRTWTTYEQAKQVAEMHDGLGLGFVFQQDAGIVGIDLDKCRDAQTGVMEPWAEDIVRDLNSYTEVSPSGKGVHTYVCGALPPGRRKRGRVEVYESGRFFTVTGRPLKDTPLTVEARAEQLTAFHAQHLADPVPLHPTQTMTRTAPLGDVQIMDLCRTAQNAPKFDALWGGSASGYASQSDADLALLGIMKFYTQNAAQLDRLFRQSGLMREKWDARRGEQTYGELTIAEALAHVRETYGRSINGHAIDHPAGMSVLSVSLSAEWPEMMPVKAELLPVTPLPLKMVPAPFRDWIKDVSDRMQCPPDFVAAGMIVMAGSIIGAGCGIRPKKHDDWTVVPNLWGGVVGRPSMLKTPAIGEAMKPLENLELTAKHEYDAAMKDHGAEVEAFTAHREALQGEMRKVAKGKPAVSGHATPTMDGLKYDFAHLEKPHAPVWRRYKTNDATIEKMAELQADNPRGLLLFRDELIGLFATWDRENHESDRAFYLESWNGNSPYTTDRIGRGTLYVENNCVSLFGGIQPTKLSGYLLAAMRGQNNDGLVQRLQVLVYPDEPATWTLVDTPIKTEARHTAYRVIQQLASMDFRQQGAYGDEGQRIPYYRFDEAAQPVFYEWLEKLETKLRAGDDEPVVLEHLGKYRSMMPSLALIFHLVSLASEHRPLSLQVSKDSAECAAAWCAYLESHARRVYGMVTDLTAQAAARLASKLTQGLLPDPFTVRDVYRKDWSLLDERPIIEKACEELVSVGWLREKVTARAPGQRGKVEYMTNPNMRHHG